MWEAVGGWEWGFVGMCGCTCGYGIVGVGATGCRTASGYAGKWGKWRQRVEVSGVEGLCWCPAQPALVEPRVGWQECKAWVGRGP